MSVYFAKTELNMTKAKKYLRFLPEIYFMASALYYWTLAGKELNYIAVGIILVMVAQIALKLKVLGMITSGLLILVNCLLVLALISELREYPTFNAEAQKMALFGTLYLGTNLAMAGFMFFKSAVEYFSPSEVVVQK